MAAKPITGQAFFVLTALADGPRHGYGIVGDVAELSQGRVKLKIGSLYGVLDRLAADGLIEPDREEMREGRLRRYFRLTQDEQRALAGCGPRAAAVLSHGTEQAEPASRHRSGGAGETVADQGAGSPMSSDLERRYRRVLRLLPGWYRKRWEEDMVAAFLDSWLTGDSEADEYISKTAGPGWAEAASVAGLAVRVYLGGAGNPRAEPQSPPRAGVHRGEILFCLVVFAVLCVAVLRVAPVLVEPDDRAYLASIIGITDGHLLTLSNAQAQSLANQVQVLSGRPFLIQWTQLANGRWISQKDPGYPFLAVPFQLLGIIRLAPLWYGLLGCIGLFLGARRWLGRFGGAAAVGLYCSSGAAIQFAWRDYMPTFTDASLIAAGTGLLLWAVLAADASPRRRTWAGVVAFAALGAATFSRYTDIVVLGCAVLAVIVAWRLRQVPARALAWWLGTVVLCCAGIAVFNDLVYGGPLNSGYPPGLIQFSLSAIPLNLRYMPAHLIDAMPMLVLGLAALAWIIVQAVRQRRAGAGPNSAIRRDLTVGLALAASWATMWGLYAAYTWTAVPGLPALSAVRFYVPALAAIALLGAWLITRLPRRESRLAVSCAVLVVPMLFMGLWSYHDTIERVHQFLRQPVPVRVSPVPVHTASVRTGAPGPGGQGGPSPSTPAGGAP